VLGEVMVRMAGDFIGVEGGGLYVILIAIKIYLL